MGFPEKVKAAAFAASGRCCCICHKQCGTKIELHHIKQHADGGDDTFENAIPLCFDCHADMGRIDPHHPRGNHYSEEELRMHRDNWYNTVSAHADKIATVGRSKQLNNRKPRPRVIRSKDPYLSGNDDW